VSEFDVKIDYYAVLGVASTAGEDEIQKAYHALAAKYHPDKHQGNELEDLAREKLTQLNTAFFVVGNPERRARYDAARRAGRASYPPEQGAPAGPPGGARTDPFNIARVVLIVVAVLAALRFGLPLVRNPRVLAIVVAAIAAVWFLPRIIRYLKKK
jgi:hypothetical protein